MHLAVALLAAFAFLACVPRTQANSLEQLGVVIGTILVLVWCQSATDGVVKVAITGIGAALAIKWIVYDQRRPKSETKGK